MQITLPLSLPTNPSILKIRCGGKYYIAKTHNILWFSNELPRQYDRYFNGTLPENGLYYPLIKYAFERSYDLTFEVLFTDVSGYQILKFELDYLLKHFGKKTCLNQNKLPHIPKTQLNGTGAVWLQPSEEMNYRKLLKKKGTSGGRERLLCGVWNEEEGAFYL